MKELCAIFTGFADRHLGRGILYFKLDFLSHKCNDNASVTAKNFRVGQY